MMNTRALRARSNASTSRFMRQTAAFHVHLGGGDAIARAGNFEVHIAGAVFNALDIGEQYGARFIAHHTDGDTGNRAS